MSQKVVGLYVRLPPPKPSAKTGEMHEDAIVIAQITDIMRLGRYKKSPPGGENMNHYIYAQILNMQAMAKTFGQSCELAAMKDDGQISKAAEAYQSRRGSVL